MKSDVLRSTRDGAVAILELNRPSAKNSLNHDLLVALRRELAAAKHDGTVRAVVITGADGVFCAGADITTFDVLRQQSLLGDREALGGDIWSALGTYRKPVIAAVEGLALGGGCELALACDIVIAGESAKFGVPEVKLGVIPGGGGTQRLIHAVGKSKAMAMLLTGDFISAQKACGDGIVADTVPPDSTTLDHALKMAQRIAKNSPASRRIGQRRRPTRIRDITVAGPRTRKAQLRRRTAVRRLPRRPGRVPSEARPPRIHRKVDTIMSELFPPNYRSPPWETDDQALLRKHAAEFFRKEATPPNQERWAKQHHVDREFWHKAGDAGLLCSDCPRSTAGGRRQFRARSRRPAGTRPCTRHRIRLQRAFDDRRALHRRLRDRGAEEALDPEDGRW